LKEVFIYDIILICERYLQDFIDNVNSLIVNGVLPQESGQTLIDATDEVIRNL